METSGWRAAWLVGTVALGCGESATVQDAGPLADAALSEVTGSWVDEHVTSDGVESVAVDLSSKKVSAWVEGAGGTLRRLPGDGFEDGTFAIEDVPERDVLVTVAAHGTVTAARSIEFGARVTGRPGVAAPQEGTALALDLAEMTPWGDGDKLAAFSANTGIHAPWLELLAQSPPEPGANALSLEMPWLEPLTEAELGDGMTLLHYQFVDGSDSYWAPVDVFEAGPTTLAGGSTNEMTGTFERLEEQSRLEVDWNARAWESFFEAVHPKDVYPFGFRSIGIYAYTGEGDSLFPEWPPILELADTRTRVKTGSYPYLNPFPPHWQPVVYAAVHFAYEQELPGSDTVLALAEMSRTIPFEAYRPIDLRVGLSPPGPVRVEGDPGSMPRALASETPLVEWKAPAIGAATAYRVEVLEVVSAFEVPIVARYLTAARRLRIPPGVLQEGARYLFRVYAMRTPDDAPTRHPNRTELPQAKAGAISGIVWR